MTMKSDAVLREFSPVFLQNGNKVWRSRPHVQEHGQLQAGSQLKMPFEPLLLCLLVAEL